MKQLEIEYLTNDSRIINTKKPINDDLIEKTKELRGVDRVNKRGKYSFFINRGRLFCWSSVEKDLINLLREENYIE